jgi:hypothetical protein
MDLHCQIATIPIDSLHNSLHPKRQAYLGLTTYVV